MRAGTTAHNPGRCSAPFTCALVLRSTPLLGLRLLGVPRSMRARCKPGSACVRSHMYHAVSMCVHACTYTCKACERVRKQRYACVFVCVCVCVCAQACVHHRKRTSDDQAQMKACPADRRKV